MCASASYRAVCWRRTSLSSSARSAALTSRGYPGGSCLNQCWGFGHQRPCPPPFSPFPFWCPSTFLAPDTAALSLPCLSAPVLLCAPRCPRPLSLQPLFVLAYLCPLLSSAPPGGSTSPMILAAVFSQNSKCRQKGVFSREMTYFFGFYGPKIGGGSSYPKFVQKYQKL